MLVKFVYILSAVFLLAGCASSAIPTTGWTPPPPTIPPENTVLARAQYNYNFYCAHCHGYSGDGQGASSEQHTLSLGYKTVPRHDSQGHTWEHPDQLLYETIKYGVQSPLNLYPMTEYGSRLTDDEIWGIIAYIKRFWTPQQQRHQREVTRLFTENHANWEAYHLDETND